MDTDTLYGEFKPKNIVWNNLDKKWMWWVPMPDLNFRPVDLNLNIRFAGLDPDCVRFYPNCADEHERPLQFRRTQLYYKQLFRICSGATETPLLTGDKHIDCFLLPSRKTEVLVGRHTFPVLVGRHTFPVLLLTREQYETTCISRDTPDALWVEGKDGVHIFRSTTYCNQNYVGWLVEIMKHYQKANIPGNTYPVGWWNEKLLLEQAARTIVRAIFRGVGKIFRKKVLLCEVAVRMSLPTYLRNFLFELICK